MRSRVASAGSESQDAQRSLQQEEDLRGAARDSAQEEEDQEQRSLVQRSCREAGR